MALSADDASFLGFAVEAIFYGLYLPIFFLSLVSLVWFRTTQSIHYVNLTASCILFACCTAHFALEFDNKYTTFVRQSNLTGISTETSELFGADILLSVTDFIAQLVLVYRCWVIWSRNYWIILFPLILALLSVSCAMAGLALLSLSENPTSAFAPSAIKPLGTSSFIISLAVNVLLTGLIVGRIWHLSRGSQEFFSSTNDQVKSVINTIIESGFLFLIAQLIVVILFALGHPAQNIVAPAALQIYGITPTLIIVRVGFQTSEHWSSKSISRGNTDRHISVPTVSSRFYRNDVELASFQGDKWEIVTTPTSGQIPR